MNAHSNVVFRLKVFNK